MALVVGANSYVTISEADAYLTDRVGSSNWFTLPDTDNPGTDSKEVYLVSAYNWLNSLNSIDLPASSTDQIIKNAQIESALYLLEFYPALNNRRAAQAQGVESFGLSKRKENYKLDEGYPKEIPSHIMAILSEYGVLNTVVDFRGHYDG